MYGFTKTTLLLVLIACACFFSTSCFFSNNEQPLVHRDPHLIQEFRTRPKFPYQATDERQTKILSNYQKLKAGMAGSEVLDIIGNPDEIESSSISGKSQSGWKWSYNIYKKFDKTADESDRNVTVYFNAEGKVEQILPKKVG